MDSNVSFDYGLRDYETTRLVSNDRPRILFVSYTAEWAGPTNSLLLLLQYVQHGYNVAVLLPGDGAFADALEREQIRTFSLPTLGKEAIPHIIRLIRDEQFSVVYGNNTSGSTRNAFIAAKLTGVPFVCHVRGMGRQKSWRDLFYLRYSDAVIAVSDACAGSIARFTRSDRLHVVHNGIAPQIGTGNSHHADTLVDVELCLDADDTVVLSLAHVKPRKGQEYAVAAMQMLVSELPSLRLLLAGSLDRDPNYVEKIETMIECAGLGSHVALLGFRTDVQPLLRRADIFVHTALADPHPRAVIEAMAAGVPVVAFAVDGVAETVTDGETGYLVPAGDTSALADEVRRLAVDRSLRQRLGENARRRAEEHFSAETTAQEVVDIIEGVLTR